VKITGSQPSGLVYGSYTARGGTLTMTLAELNRLAFTTLIENLGYVNAVRFFKQFDTGSGNYTEDRHQWLDNVSIDEIWADLQIKQKGLDSSQ
jgi:hypothetical protein